MNWLKSLVLPMVKSLVKANVTKLELLKPQFVAILAKELPADTADKLADALMQATEAEVCHLIDQL